MLTYGAPVVYRQIDSKLIQVLVCIIICCFTGYLFYLAENKITQWVLCAVQKKNYFRKEVTYIENHVNQSFTEKY